MKIVCDACQAKYSISDDKVQGKVFKIRCKKCSNIIVVRGGASSAGAEPAPQPAFEKDTRVHDYGYDGGGAPAGDEAVWHVVINQDQVGPMTAADVQARFSAGEIDAETYIWREGFADWMPMLQVNQFASFVASGSQTAAVGGGGASAVASMFGGGLGENEAGTVRSNPGDLFATASSSARHGDDDGGDLFGSKPARATAAGDAAASKMRGERNENSVLFSLNNLAQLASDKPAPVTAAPSSASAAGHATGSAGGEGSGLIDIRSMANAYLGGSGGAAKPATASSIGSIDDLPVFGGGGFSEPAVIVPTARAAGNSKLMYALIGSVGLLAVAAVILVVVMLKGDKEKPAQVAAGGSDEKKNPEVKPDQPTPDPAGSAAATPPPPDPDTKTEPGRGSAAESPDPTAAKPDPKAAKPDTKPDPKPDRKPTVAKRDPRPTPGIGSVAKSDPKPKVVEKTVEPSSSSCDEVSCVLNNYEGSCCQKFRKGSKPSTGGGSPIGEKPKSDLPDSLDRTMISEGVGKVKARVMACGDKSSAKGQVKVSVKVNPDGGVSSVTVKTTPDAGLGNCVMSAMQRATFKRTASGGSFGYPFVF